jgi:hypothetical protein
VDIIFRPTDSGGCTSQEWKTHMLEFLSAVISQYDGCAPVKVKRLGDRASNIATLIAVDEHGIIVSYHGPDESKRFAHPWASVMSVELSMEG